MEKNTEKAELISAAHNYRSERGYAIILRLLEICIDEVRILNDHVEPSELKFNQGQIEAFQQLKNFIQKGLPELAKAGRNLKDSKLP